MQWLVDLRPCLVGKFFWILELFVVIVQLIFNYGLIRLKIFVSSFIVKLCNQLFFQLHLILHAYIRRFDVISTVRKILGTKQSLNVIEDHDTVHYYYHTRSI